MPKRKVMRFRKVKHKGKDYVQLSTPHGPGLFAWKSYVNSLQRYDDVKKSKKK